MNREFTLDVIRYTSRRAKCWSNDLLHRCAVVLVPDSWGLRIV